MTRRGEQEGACCRCGRPVDPRSDPFRPCTSCLVAEYPQTDPPCESPAEAAQRQARYEERLQREADEAAAVIEALSPAMARVVALMRRGFVNRSPNGARWYVFDFQSAKHIGFIHPWTLKALRNRKVVYSVGVSIVKLQPQYKELAA